MSGYFKTWHTRITAELAERETDRLFAKEDQECSAIIGPKSIKPTKASRYPRPNLQPSGKPFQRAKG